MPIRDIKLDDTGDLALESGDLVLVGGTTDAENIAAIAQHVRIRVLTFLGEWFLDESRGVPYRERIFRKGARPGLVQSLLRRAIEQTPGVRAVTEFSLEIDRRARSARATWRASSDVGEISGAVALPSQPVAS
jgi:hypothetical protein